MYILLYSISSTKIYTSDLDLFDFYIDYEDIRDWFIIQSDLKLRKDFKVMMLNSAIEKLRRGYFAVPDRNVTAFWWRYYQYCCANYPELMMKRPGMHIPGLSGFVRFEPKPITQVKGRQMIHKLLYGNLDVQLDGIANKLDLFKEAFEGRLGSNIKIVKAGKSICFRVKAPELDPTKDFEEQIHQVEFSLERLRFLYEWATKYVFHKPFNM